MKRNGREKNSPCNENAWNDSRSNFHMCHVTTVTAVTMLYITSLVLTYLTTGSLYPSISCSFIDSFIQRVRRLSGSNITIFIINYLSQNHLTSGFWTFVVVVVSLGGQHLGGIRLWVQTTWKWETSWVIWFRLVFHWSWSQISIMNDYVAIHFGTSFAFFILLFLW